MVVSSIVTLKKVQTERGSEVYSFLVKVAHISCKVGSVAKVHTEENADYLDGAFLRVISVVTQQDKYVIDKCRMYRNYGSVQATIIPVSEVSVKYGMMLN